MAFGNQEERLLLLRATPFGKMPDEALAKLSRLMEFQEVAAGKILCREGEDEGRFCIVAEGLLKTYRILPPAREITIFLLRPKESFGFLPLLDGGPLPMNVQAVLPSKVLILRRQAFLSFLRETPDFSRVLLEHLAGKLRECVDRLGVVTSQGAASRTAQALMSLAVPTEGGDGSSVATFPVSQVELARTLGIAPENLSRALARFLKEGLIVRAGRRRFHIPSLERLRALAEER